MLRQHRHNNSHKDGPKVLNTVKPVYENTNQFGFKIPLGKSKNKRVIKQEHFNQIAKEQPYFQGKMFKINPSNPFLQQSTKSEPLPETNLGKLTFQQHHHQMVDSHHVHSILDTTNRKRQKVHDTSTFNKMYYRPVSVAAPRQ